MAAGVAHLARRVSARTRRFRGDIQAPFPTAAEPSLILDAQRFWLTRECRAMMGAAWDVSSR